MLQPLGLGLVAAAGAAVAYVTRLVGPKVRAGDVKLATTAGLIPAAQAQFQQFIGPAPMFLMRVEGFDPDTRGFYGTLLGAGVPTGVGTDLVRVTRFATTPPQKVFNIPEGAFVQNRWQG